MKVIFSRKGFDSQYGGWPSPILPDGRLLPLPIPSTHDRTQMGALDILDDSAMECVLKDLYKGKYNLHTTVHFDPDLGGKHTAHLPGWQPTLGQTGAAQGHLRNNKIQQGDIFLFFGWFRCVEQVNGRWQFAPKAPDLHVIFGWLEVDVVLSIVREREAILDRYPWLALHPHVASPDWYTDSRNTLYIGRNRSTLTGRATYGGGRFPKMASALQLTSPDQPQRTTWSLPAWFAPQGRPPLSYHPKSSQWNVQGDKTILRSVPKGQEFVIDGNFYPQLESWIKALIVNHA